MQQFNTCHLCTISCENYGRFACSKKKKRVNQESRKYRVEGIRRMVKKLPRLELWNNYEEQIVQTAEKWRDMDANILKTNPPKTKMEINLKNKGFPLWCSALSIPSFHCRNRLLLWKGFNIWPRTSARPPKFKK